MRDRDYKPFDVVVVDYSGDVFVEGSVYISTGLRLRSLASSRDIRLIKPLSELAERWGTRNMVSRYSRVRKDFGKGLKDFIRVFDGFDAIAVVDVVAERSPNYRRA